MSYEILESRIEFNNNQIQRITVLVNCTSSQSKPYSDVRAIYATNKPCGGYMWIPLNAKLTDDLMQSVAGAGMETRDRDKIFPGWKKT
ncbi:MAG: hypothetical protein RLZ10_413, partial [Bacteroidota bacterium]